MENDFYIIFKRIIRECNYDNTYKMAWAKALVEIAIENEFKEEFIDISLEEIAKKFIKYYWNQTIYFNLIQGSNLIKTPVILQKVKELIEEYFSCINSRKPDRFEGVEYLINDKLNNEYKHCLNSRVKTLKADVSWRFTFIDRKNHDEIYKYSKGENKITISKENLEILKANSQDLFDLINYRWGLILETFNSSPRINKKVKIIDEIDIKRNSLNKFKKYLDEENKERICFICGKKIHENELSIDHVIPWSYLYADDLWNLVYVHRNCNSSKNNVIPNKNDIDRLKQRNNKLIEILDKNNIKGKDVDELRLAMDKDYVNKFWIGCKS